MKLTRRQIAIMRPSGPHIIEAQVTESGEWAIHKGYGHPWVVTHVSSGTCAFRGTYAQCRRLMTALERDGCGVFIQAEFPLPRVYHDKRAREIVSQFHQKEQA